MSISWDNWHKNRMTSGKRNPYHKSRTLSVVLTKQESLMLPTMHLVRSWSAPRPWGRTVLCLLTAHHTDRGESTIVHFSWGHKKNKLTLEKEEILNNNNNKKIKENSKEIR
ncbi:hypothetical protein A6R68_24149 [Neotoma lepida]|uniref:Uncharacterized protein n=1 Tax=Neotoma lepida TaxID=56216 RepID=A0A1A6HUE4_NEOLE|nr:hypothetical protein A6R68_24149 [Neotoma lepida]